MTHPPCGAFDLDQVQVRGPRAAVVKWLLDDPQWWMGLLRRFWPIAHVGNWVIVTRFAHVREVLSQDQVFQVHFGRQMMDLTLGTNFVLGMQDGPEYRRDIAQLMQAFRREDVPAVITPRSAQLAAQIVDGSRGRLDAIEGLITRVPTLLCEQYYGVPIPDPALFAQWTIVMSGYLFGPPGPKGKEPRDAGQARAAASCFRPLVDQAIRDVKASRARPDTVLARLVTMQEQGAAGLTDDVIRADLFGMITGFIPTNTIAAGHVLEMLFRRPDFLERAQHAALENDDDLLRRCLFEAMRFKPINPGPFRVCASDYTIAAGTGDARVIKAGTNVLASTQSAMFDERGVANPTQFNPGRPASEYLLFGSGLHWCAGAYIAQAQITQTLKPLLRKSRLRRAAGKAGQMQMLNLFPAHLTVEFDP